MKKYIQIAANIGCGRGFVSKNISGSIKELILCDSSNVMLRQAEYPPELKIKKVITDEENWKLEDNNLDLVISSLSLHWVNDLPKCFEHILHSLKSDGVFIASIFGGDTLFELRSSLQLAELERKQGISAHISPLTQISDIAFLLNNAGFNMITIDTDEIVIGYPSIFELLGDLKGMAENNATINRPLNINRDILFSAGAIYNKLYGRECRINATFQIIYFVGWKPSPHVGWKPSPQRGSANASFTELETILEKK